MICEYPTYTDVQSAVSNVQSPVSNVNIFVYTVGELKDLTNCC